MKKILLYNFSVLTFLLIWQILSSAINAPLILPSPVYVAVYFINCILTPGYWFSFGYTFLRVIITFVISFVLGIITGCLCGINKSIKDFLAFPMALIRSTPVVALILVALFWFDSFAVPVFIGVLMCLPIMASNVENGFLYTDKKLLQMGQTFNFSKSQKIKYIFLPNILPCIGSGAEQIFGFSWKVVVAGEVLSLPRYGLGTKMQFSQVHLETATVIATALMLVILSCILSKLFKLFIRFIFSKGHSNKD